MTTTTPRTTTAKRTAATKRTPMDKMRKTALVAGIFYLITFISIPTLALYGPVKNHADWILSPAARVLEAGIIFTGVVSLLSLVTFRPCPITIDSITALQTQELT
jgi:hypothetical protein